MKRNSESLSPRDIERLSVYLDGALSPQETEAFEARLRSEVQLRRRLEELRHTIAQLKSLPAIKAPRTFTLTPEMAGLKSQRKSLFSFFRMATAIASVALAIVVGLDLAVASGQLPSLSTAAGEMTEDTALFDDAAQRAEAPEEPEADLGEPMAMQLTEEQGEGMAAESEAVTEAPAAEDSTAECADCPTPSIAEAELAPPTEGRDELSIAATVIAKWSLTGQDEGAVDQDDFAQPGSAYEGRDFWTPIRLTEAGLAGLVLVLVISTIYLRRKQA